MTINLKNKPEIIEKHGKDSKDTGSVNVQVAMLSQKISELTEHLKVNPKDFAGLRGLLMMVGKRRSMLSYLKKRNIQEYRDLVAELKIRAN